MVSTSRVINIGLASLAGLAAIAWQPAQAQCNTNAWAQPTTGAPLASGPGATAGFIRYSGSCGLRPANPGPSFVEESNRHAAEGGTTPFRARFFAYTGVSAGSPVVFRARAAGGATVIDITYDRAGQRFTFAPAGVAAVSTAANSAPPDRWIEVNFVYQAAQPFNAQTRHRGVTTSIAPTAAVGAATVEDVRFGLVSGTATGTLFVDEYEASRSLAGGAGVFTLLCRGDANFNGAYNLVDIFGVVDEFLRNQGDSSRNRATGQPDIDQNGLIELADIFGVVDAFLAGEAGAPGSGCNNIVNH